MNNTKFQFPAEFVEQVKDAFPNHNTLFHYLDRGFIQEVGRAMQESTRWFEPNLVVSMLQAGKTQELLSMAEQQVKRGRLYRQWQTQFAHESDFA